MLLEGKGNHSAALELYDIALETDSTSLILSRRRIACLKSLGGAGGAAKVVEALNKHVDTFYNDPEAWQELAEVYADQGLYAQSAFALEEVILQVPQNAFFHLKYAETLYTQGEVAKAYKAYLRVLELCQSDGEATTTKGGPWVRALWGLKMVRTPSSFPALRTHLILTTTSSCNASDNNGTHRDTVIRQIRSRRYNRRRRRSNQSQEDRSARHRSFT